MNAYRAMLLAADHIETHPKQFDYKSINIPDPKDEGLHVACAYGRTLSFLGEPWASFGKTGEMDPYFVFEIRMGSVEHWWEFSWKRSAKRAARCLRRYAEKYYGDHSVVADYFPAGLNTFPI